jgi:RimJ/RimL family protein N-acetyltransferase
MIRTERLLLRKWREEDIEPFAAINEDPVVMRHFPATLSRAQTEAGVARIHAHFARYGWGLFAAEYEGLFIGYVGLLHVPFESHFTPAVEIGWRLGSAYWNRGLATEGARAVLDFGFREAELAEIVSFTTTGNAASRRVMEKIGMERVAAGDFDHPRVPEGSPLRRHVLYKKSRTEWPPPAAG